MLTMECSEEVDLQVEKSAFHSSSSKQPLTQPYSDIKCGRKKVKTVSPQYFTEYIVDADNRELSLARFCL